MVKGSEAFSSSGTWASRMGSIVFRLEWHAAAFCRRVEGALVILSEPVDSYYVAFEKIAIPGHQC